MKPETLSIQGELFENMRERFDYSINSMVRKMLEKGLRSGALSVKVKIGILETADERTGDVVKRAVFDPKITVKISDEAEVKCAPKPSMLMQIEDDGSVTVGTSQIEMEELLMNGGLKNAG